MTFARPRTAIVRPTRNTLDLRLFHSFAVFFGHGDEPLRFRFDDGVFLRLFLEFLFDLLRLLEAFASRLKVKLIGELDQRVRHADVQNAAPAKMMLASLPNKPTALQPKPTTRNINPAFYRPGCNELSLTWPTGEWICSRRKSRMSRK